MADSQKEFITVARVAKTQGRHGEVAADLFTDFPEKFAERKRLSAWMKDGTRRELKVEEFWPHKQRMVFKFAGVDDMNAAEELIGAELQIAKNDRAELEENTAYVSDLKGCRVFDGKTEVGVVTEVDFSTGEAPNLIVTAGKKELMVPFAGAYLRKLDVAGKRIEMELPQGLLEVDAPLSSDEKKRRSEQD
jgi:16S rRNA processing protein RimM